MTLRWLCLVVTGVVLAGTGPARAAGLNQEFVEGLRARHYYDYALIYLDQAEADARTPDEFRRVIPFERALTLIGQARITRDPEQQNQQLDRAEAQLEQFARANPDHPRAAQANSERAKIHLEKARVAIYQARSPANQGNRAELQKQAQSVLLQYAIFRWESALIVAITIVLTFLLPRPFVWWPRFGWPLLGLIGLAALVISSLTDAQANARILHQLFQEQFDPRRIRDRELRSKVESALEYERRIELLVPQRGEGHRRMAIYYR
jgi:hypothetical protein